MAEPTWNPLQLDVQAFAKAGARLEGEWPAQSLPRFAEGGDASAWPAVRYAVAGDTQAVLGADAEIWLSLQVQAEAEAVCQRCLKPVRLPLQPADVAPGTGTRPQEVLPFGHAAA